MIRTIALAVGLTAALSGCQALQNLQTVSAAQTAADQVASAVTAIKDPAASTLTKAQAAACAGQAVANAVTDMLNATGHQGDANAAAKVSTALGYGCAWSLPAL